MHCAPMARTDDGMFDVVGSSHSNSWVDNAVPLDHTYTYYVTAFTADGVESPPSLMTAVSVTTMVVTPPVFYVYLPLAIR